jgi:hypothetical protein
MLKRSFYTFLLYTFSSISYASIITNPQTCNVENSQLISVTSVLDTNDPKTELLTSQHSATSCVGVFSGANDDPLSSPFLNIGQFGDGLLNGGNAFFTGMEFIETSDLQDVDGIDGKNDPGWVRLAHFDAGNSNNSASGITYDTAGPIANNLEYPELVLDISDLLTLGLTCSNGALGDCKQLDWTLATNALIIPTVQQLLGNATFDHLAFSVKAGNRFAVYDFNFNDIFEDESLLNFQTPYILSGSISTSDFINNSKNGKSKSFAGISHLNVWARDPVDNSTQVPGPSSLAILSLGIIGFASRRFIKWAVNKTT